MKLSKTCNNLFYSEIKKRVIEEFEVLPVTELSEIYVKTSGENQETPTRRTLIDVIKKHFKDQIASWVPKSGPQFIFNDEVDKGHIIEVLVRQINNLKLKEESADDQIKTVGAMIRNDTKEVPSTLVWPPSEQQLLAANSILPESLTSLLTNILSSKSKITGEKMQQKVQSLGEDFIYSVSNGMVRTKKYVLLSFCIKRKTGSKDVLKWLNRLGHGISYDEVNVLETFLADQAVFNQTNRAFCPSSVQPSFFVTFVWDNNDINPDSLNGNVMHCTNGIIVQLPRKNALVNSTPRLPAIRKRKRTFQASPSELPVYKKEIRQNPTHLNTFKVLYFKIYFKY